MSHRSKLFKFILIPTLILLGIIIILFFLRIISEQDLYSILISYLLTTQNFIAGSISIKIAKDKPTKTFMKIILGGLTIRLLFILGMILIALNFLDINRNSFIFSIFIFYIIYLIIEILHLNLTKN
jgi:hypothetical protein